MKNANKKTSNNAVTKRKHLLFVRYTILDVLCLWRCIRTRRLRDIEINKCDMKHENNAQSTIDSKFDCKFNLLCLASMAFIHPLRV